MTTGFIRNMFVSIASYLQINNENFYFTRLVAISSFNFI